MFLCELHSKLEKFLEGARRVVESGEIEVVSDDYMEAKAWF